MSLGYITQHIKKDVCVTYTQAVPAEGPPNVVWKISCILLSVISPTAVLIITGIQYRPKYDFIAPSVFVVALFLGTVLWFYTMASMNLLHKISRARMLAFPIQILAIICNFGAALAVMQKDGVMQYVSGFFSAVLGWISFITIFEGEFRIPTKQQFSSLLQIIIISALWDTRTFIVNKHF